MTNTDLTKIREEKKLSKKEFAALLGVTPMLLGRYEKGSCAIPESVAEKLMAKADDAVVAEVEVKKTVRRSGRKTREKVEEAAAEVKEVIEEKVVTTEIETKKKTRETARAVKETCKAAAQSDAVVAAEIEAKKKTRAAGREVKEKTKKIVAGVKRNVKKEASIPNIIIQSPMGGYISTEAIAKKVPQGTADVYIRVDENKLYYVLENGETGDVDIWD